jgi:hypothetical protein
MKADPAPQQRHQQLVTLTRLKMEQAFEELSQRASYLHSLTRSLENLDDYLEQKIYEACTQTRIMNGTATSIAFRQKAGGSEIASSLGLSDNEDEGIDLDDTGLFLEDDILERDRFVSSTSTDVYQHQPPSDKGLLNILSRTNSHDSHHSHDTAPVDGHSSECSSTSSSSLQFSLLAPPANLKQSAALTKQPLKSSQTSQPLLSEDILAQYAGPIIDIDPFYRLTLAVKW